MKAETIFQEKQYFRQWWLWLILLIINAITIFLFARYFFDSSSTDRSVASILLNSISVCFSLLLTLLFAFMHLDTMVKTDGIYLRFFPIHLSYKKYTWSILHQANIRTYNALSEYGGWGIRYSFSKNGIAYTISGSTGLQLEQKDGKKILIGTDRAEELQATLPRELLESTR